VGSIAYQRRWCVHGTQDRYILLQELVESVSYAAYHKATQPVLSRRLSDQEKSSLLEFYTNVDAMLDAAPWGDDRVGIEELVEHEALQAIRRSANDCLRKIGFQYNDEELTED